MNIQEFIDSGIIENYVLGATTPAENQEVEKMAMKYPEIQKEIEASKFALMEYILQYQQEPPPELQDKVLSKLDQLHGQTRSYPRFSWPREQSYASILGVAAALFLLVSLATNAYLYYRWSETRKALRIAQTENIRMAGALKNVETQYHSLDQELALATHPATHKITLGSNPPITKTASVTVLWNDQLSKVYLQVNHLPPPPLGKQYQLWSVHQGDVKDAGMIRMPQESTSTTIQLMHDTPQADAFVITLEKEGGVPVAEGQVYAEGKVSTSS